MFAGSGAVGEGTMVGGGMRTPMGTGGGATVCEGGGAAVGEGVGTAVGGSDLANECCEASGLYPPLYLHLASCHLARVTGDKDPYHLDFFPFSHPTHSVIHSREEKQHVARRC